MERTLPSKFICNVDCSRKLFLKWNKQPSINQINKSLPRSRGKKELWLSQVESSATWSEDEYFMLKYIIIQTSKDNCEWVFYLFHSFTTQLKEVQAPNYKKKKLNYVRSRSTSLICSYYYLVHTPLASTTWRILKLWSTNDLKIAKIHFWSERERELHTLVTLTTNRFINKIKLWSGEWTIR